jgi:hypothetical protein
MGMAAPSRVTLVPQYSSGGSGRRRAEGGGLALARDGQQQGHLLPWAAGAARSALAAAAAVGSLPPGRRQLARRGARALERAASLPLANPAESAT